MAWIILTNNVAKTEDKRTKIVILHGWSKSQFPYLS